MKDEIVSADHLNKPDVGSGIANAWFDADKVDVIVDVPNSGVGLGRIVRSDRSERARGIGRRAVGLQRMRRRARS
jgi:hypothetical protein